VFQEKIHKERRHGREQNLKLESTYLAALFVYRDVRVREETWFRSWKAVDKGIGILGLLLRRWNGHKGSR
jgi:hypothetical protein